MAFQSDLLNVPAEMQNYLTGLLYSQDAPVRGTDLKACVAAVLSEADKAVMQQPRANGRAETVWSNHVARGLRRLKERGAVVMVGALYELSDSAREAYKATL